MFLNLSGSFCLSLTSMKHTSIFVLLFIGILLCLTLSCDSKTKRSILCFAAHPDDWQLFVGNEIYHHLQAEDSLTFILLTSGDASLGTAALPDKTTPFYKAREKGFINAVIWACDGKLQSGFDGKSTLPLQDYTLSEVSIQGKISHQIKVFSYKNSTSYLLYLSDGLKDGRAEQSLLQFKNGKVDTLWAIDSSTYYVDWEDLVLSIQAITALHHIDKSYLPETLVSINPEDHSDHYLTGDLAMEATKDSIEMVLYQGYHIKDLEVNLEPSERDLKKFLFSANAIALEEYGGISPFDEWHHKFLDKNYFRFYQK